MGPSAFPPVSSQMGYRPIPLTITTKMHRNPLASNRHPAAEAYNSNYGSEIV